MQIVVKSLTVLKGHLGGIYGHLGQSLKIGGNVDSMTILHLTANYIPFKKGIHLI